MLLEFAISNYKCFTEEIVFKMTPAPKIQDLKYSVLEYDKDEKIRALSTAIIYGPNATGKTNLIGAMEVLKSIIKRGHIRNEEGDEGSPNAAQNKLELIPNFMNETDRPVSFRIKFLCKDLLVEYTLVVFLGKFLEVEAKRRIEEEKLAINGKMVFNRSNNNLELGNIETILNKDYLVKNFNKTVIDKVAKSNLNDSELFFSSFKTLYSNALINIIQTWFDEDLFILYSADKLLSNPNWEVKENEAIIDENLNMALKEFGFASNFLAYGNVEGTDKKQFMAIIRNKNEKDFAVRPDIIESYGTMRFMNIYPMLREALHEGKTIIIDEFDASIHPMALMSIINIFHNDEINTKGAQLIFNTHNPIFINKNLFRRDEIKFIEKNEETGICEHYSLSDFGTSGDGSVRNTENYMNNYFLSKYGAIKDIDFSPFFRDVMEEGEEQNEKGE